ncbi:CSC1-like protein At4g02900 [Durusdinium trenchii]|uniref:CSC1-like protein At4g02900 n=1 Tax=Durusdinium trenchii TaxID=1381693 RepID=A0ABP0LTZ3_9DINO
MFAIPLRLMWLFSILTLVASEICANHETEFATNSTTLIQHLNPSVSRNGSIRSSLENVTKEVNETVAEAPEEIAKSMEWKQRFARLQGGEGGGGSIALVTEAALSGLASNLFVCSACVGLFSFLRGRYPLVFFGNMADGTMDSDQRRNWISSSLALDLEKITAVMGLDASLAIEYASFGARLMMIIGLPFLFLFSPLHRWYGGGGLEEKDFLSSISVSNVSMGHPWLYHLHALAVLWTVLAVRAMVFRAQQTFMAKRHAWLTSLPSLRANTVLVEDIPASFQCQEKVLTFFSENVGPVAHVGMVRHTEKLEAAIEARNSTKAKLEEVRKEVEFRELQGSPDMDAKMDKINLLSQELTELESQVKAEREHIKGQSAQAGGVNSHSAFVTFHCRKDAEMAKVLELSGNADWAVHDAPEASEIRWHDLLQDYSVARSAIGCFLIFLLFANFSPICLLISSAASEVNVGKLQPIWDALAPTLGLTIFLSMLPTVLLLIFGSFFKLRAESLAQHRLQTWYFLFQAVFILFLPVVGTNFRSFAKQLLADDSLSTILAQIADRIPLSGDFFFNFIVLQWSVSCMELLRMVVLAKFLLFRTTYTEAEARQKAEPEDQDFYGMGGRTARWSLNLVIGCIFCSVWPMVPLVVLLQFLMQRLAYGYLIAFAETRKPDLGGEFWCESLLQLLYCMVLFAVGMSGLLLRRSPSCIPPAVAFVGVPIAVASILQFKDRFRWRTLSIPEVVKMDHPLPTKGAKTKLDSTIYEQPALTED